MSNLGCPLIDAQGRAGRNEVAERRQHVEHDVGSAREIDQGCVIDVEQHPRSRGEENTRGFGLLRQSLGIEFVELLADLITDGLDQRGGSELAPDVIHVQDQHHDADDDQDKGDYDRHARDELGALGGVHLAQRQHRVRERADEDADRELAGLVLQEGGDDAGGELAHRELDHHQNHRQHQGGEAHHRAGDCAEDFQRRIGATGERARDQGPIEGAVHRNADHRQRDPAADADQWPEPHAGSEPVKSAEFRCRDQVTSLELGPTAEYHLSPHRPRASAFDQHPLDRAPQDLNRSPQTEPTPSGQPIDFVGR